MACMVKCPGSTSMNLKRERALHSVGTHHCTPTCYVAGKGPPRHGRPTHPAPMKTSKSNPPRPPKPQEPRATASICSEGL
eukprot:282160-Chlamydomonas_euryale.AAC.8